ncbi:MAG TPA: 6-carboxytetrahydropterin synthase QueD [Planctomycetota bacterium]|nr:6-carboxytetrahydropterin synthase QueD [Planctomycetota bacterium]
MYELVFQTHFAAAHNLRGYQGSCERLHGHNWKVDVVLRADKLDQLGMVIDFRDIKSATKGLLDSLDHRYLNELDPFHEANPTTENVSKWIFDELGKLLPAHIRIHKVTTWESENCGAAYVSE